MVSVQAVIFRLTNEENHMIDKLNIYFGGGADDPPPPPPPKPDGD